MRRERNGQSYAAGAKWREVKFTLYPSSCLSLCLSLPPMSIAVSIALYPSQCLSRGVYRAVSIALYPSLSLDCLGPCLTSVLQTVPTLGRQYQAKECKHGLLLFRICAPAAYNCPTGNGTTSKPQVPKRSVGQV